MGAKPTSDYIFVRDIVAHKLGPFFELLNHILLSTNFTVLIFFTVFFVAIFIGAFGLLFSVLIVDEINNF